jgi:hypothetical protein
MNPIEQREAHYTRFLGPLDQKVMHSTDIKPVHVDIYTFAPTSERDFYTLITGGMSDVRQNIPDDWECAPRAEIMLYTKEPKGWMYNVLKGLAEMPSDDDTFLSYRHTIPNGQPMTAEPSLLTSFFMSPVFGERDGFTPLLLDEDAVDVLLLIPITEGERALAVDQGSDALLALFRLREFDPVIDEHRSCLVTHESSPRTKNS